LDDSFPNPCVDKIGTLLIAEGRSVPDDKAQEWIDGGPYSAEKAKQFGMIDAVEHPQDLEKRVGQKV
jgi:hypothetical protein